VLYVYLAPSADPEGVRPTVEEVFGSELPPGAVQIVAQGDYPLDQLAQWYREARNSVGVVEGLQFSDLDERLGRIEFGVQTEYAAHQARKALARTGVPQDAVAIEVASPHRLDDPPVQTDSPIGVGISLDFPPTMQQGQAIPIEVVLTNEGDETVRFEYNPHHPMNVMVFNHAGDQVWAKRRGGVITLPAREAELAPGEEIRFKVYWDLTDQDGFALPPGRYLVRGTSNIHDFVESRVRPMALASGTHQLVIESAGE
jgi:hypothetical protein